MAGMTKHISNRRIRKVRRWAHFLNKQGVEVLPAQDKTEESYVKTRQAVRAFQPKLLMLSGRQQAIVIDCFR
jgi:ADP-glucose pyrophosphorylase